MPYEPDREQLAQEFLNSQALLTYKEVVQEVTRVLELIVKQNAIIAASLGKERETADCEL